MPWAPVFFGGGAKSAERAVFFARHLPFLHVYSCRQCPFRKGLGLSLHLRPGDRFGHQFWGAKRSLCEGTSSSRVRRARVARLCAAATLRHIGLSAAQLAYTVHAAGLAPTLQTSCSFCWCCYLWKPVCCLILMDQRY